MKKIMFFALAALFVGALASCHKDHLPKPKKVDPLSLINGQMGTSMAISVDQSKSIGDLTSQSFLEFYSTTTYPLGTGGKVSVTCVPVTFDRVIPVDTIKLWMAYKKLSAATSQDLAVYGASLYNSLTPDENNDNMKVVAIGDKGSNGDYLQFGDSNGDYTWDVTDVNASSFTSSTQYLVIQ